jgi:KAP family P-loop domain
LGLENYPITRSDEHSKKEEGKKQKGDEPIKILTDDELCSTENDEPVLGFDLISKTLINIIHGSTPSFSIGIYGEWGTGKSTLMRMVQNNIEERNEPNILTVWFNAWRYEREENLAINALLKSIAYRMKDHDIYKEVSPKISRSIKIITEGVITEILSKVISRETIKEVKEGLKEETLLYMDLLNEIDTDTIYFDGIHQIEEEIEKIFKNKEKKYEDSRIIVFIDDLDRCSPLKTVEILESIKIFLDMKGFIFIIGLSHNTVAKLIESQYEKVEINGQNYLQKIIHIPIILPEWKKEPDTQDLINSLLKTDKIDTNYKDLIKQKIPIISNVTEPNPRQIKRFINNFIITSQIFSEKNVQPEEFLIVQSLRFRWQNFYRIYTLNNEFRSLINDLLDFNYIEIRDILDYDKYKKKLELEYDKYKKKLENMKNMKKQEVKLDLKESIFSSSYLLEMKQDLLILEFIKAYESEKKEHVVLVNETYKKKELESIYESYKKELESKYETYKKELETQSIEKYEKKPLLWNIFSEIANREYIYFNDYLSYLNDVLIAKAIKKKDYDKYENFMKKEFWIRTINYGNSKERERADELKKQIEILEMREDMVNYIIKKYFEVYFTRLNEICDNVKKKFEVEFLEIKDELWSLLKQEKKTIVGIRNWEDYRIAADFSKEMINPNNQST